MNALSRRYAQAAVEVVMQKGDLAQVDTLAAELARFAGVFASHADLREALKNPAFKASRPNLLAAVLKGLDIGDIAARLIQLLAANGRIAGIDQVAEATQAQADKHAKRLRAWVTTAVSLTEEQKNRVTKALRQRLGQDVVLTTQVDPAIVGGLVCRVGNLTLDSSLKRQLEILTERLGAQAI